MSRDDGRRMPVDARLAEALAAAERELEQMRAAIESRTIIGRAEGIMIERLGVDAEEAFAYLKRVSSNTNTKLVEVAAQIVRTGVLPA